MEGRYTLTRQWRRTTQDNKFWCHHSNNICSHKMFILSQIIFHSMLRRLQIVSAHFCQILSLMNDRAERNEEMCLYL